jgi:crossover junction endonuclease MUS81
MLKLVVVPGEKKIIDELVSQKIPFDLRPLDVGDIHIVRIHEDGVEKVEMIIERKEGKDLEASIKDGRYREQKARLKSLICEKFESWRIAYLIENVPKTSSIEKSLWSSMTNTVCRDRFTVFQTKNTSESVKWLGSLMASLEKHEDVASTQETSKPNLLITETQIKKRKVVPTDFYLNTLLLIPGVNEAAQVIVETYPTLTSLITALKNSPSPKSVLKDIPLKSGKRKLGPALSERICEYVLALAM